MMDYEAKRIRELEAEGMSHSDAIAVFDAENLRAAKNQREITVGTVIAGTHKASDLIPAFYKELERVAPITANLRREGTYKEEIEEALAGKLEYRDTSEEFSATDEWVSEAVEVLMDSLCDQAPGGMYFGCHEGDASDYGWWSLEDGP